MKWTGGTVMTIEGSLGRAGGRQMMWLHRTFIALCFVSLLSNPTRGQVTEFFDQTDFASNAGGLTVIDFDSLLPGDNVLAGTEFTPVGVTIVQRDGGPINVVQNLVPGSYGDNFVTEANINSPPNAISSSIRQFTALANSDNFDFILEPAVSAAGVFIGNLGNQGDVPKTTVQFLDASDQVMAEEVLGQFHAGVIVGLVGVAWDRRIFYGITTSQPTIKTIRVINGPNDGDGITIDDVQFGAAVTTLQVAIDIKPGSDPNCFNMNGHGVVPVAIMGASNFDVSDINTGELYFDGLEVRVRGNKGPLCNVEDSNGDAYPDLVCHFEDDPENWTGGGAEGTVTGELFDGTTFEGSDSICIVP